MATIRVTAEAFEIMDVLMLNAYTFNQDPVKFLAKAMEAKAEPVEEIRYSCPICGGDTRHEFGPCGKCLLW
jgi:hypothetical protein